MKFRLKASGDIVEAEQFWDHKSPILTGGLIDRGSDGTKGVDGLGCTQCGHPLSSHLYLSYGATKLELCCMDYVIYDQKHDSYYKLSQEALYQHATPLNDPDVCELSHHPLKNPDASHYAMWHNGDGEAIEAIDLMEKMFTTEELLAWAKITALKYRLRIGKKDDITKEMKKIETYEAYIAYLEHKIRIERMPKCTPEGMASMRRVLDAKFEKHRAFFKANEAKN